MKAVNIDPFVKSSFLLISFLWLDKGMRIWSVDDLYLFNYV